MTLHFTSQSIPELKDKSVSERIEAIERATKKLTPPEKLMLNIIKLLIIVPVFAFILRAGQDWTALIWAGFFIFAYPFVLRPVQLNMIKKYLK